MKKIKLTQNQFAIVDDVHFEWLNQWKWYASWNAFTNSYYAVRKSPRSEGHYSIGMHRLIVDLEFGDPREADHINRRTLDNRKSNLRIVDERKNQENRKDQSQYGPGVTFSKRHRTKPFRVKTKVNGKAVHIGMFETAKIAQQARANFLKERGLR